MPRIKCRFCDNRLVVRPSILENENYVPKCHTCYNNPPPEGWRCNGKIITRCKKRGVKKGDRCRSWIKEEGDKYCHYHKYQGEENEARPNYRQ